MMSHHVTYHVTAMSHASSPFQEKRKKKKKKNQYEIRKIKEEKDKNC